MSTEHTPGPWIVNSCTRSGNMAQRYRWLIANEEGQDAETIAEIPVNTSPDDPTGEYDHRAEADAYLIAAAPDLLAALRVAEGIISRAAQHIDAPGFITDADDAMVAIGAAIAKAENK